MHIGEIFVKITRKLYFKNRDNLLSFSPQKMANENSYIVDQLKKATSVFNYNDNNIALEGDYGTGKSSILKQLKGRLIWRIINRPKTISFFAFYTDKKEIPDADKKEIPDADKKEIPDAEIQSEIIKQLYFGEKANKLKGSGYQRIGKHYYGISITLAILLEIFVTPRLIGTDILSIINNVKTIFNPNIKLNETEIINTLVWTTSVVLIAALLNIALKLLSNVNIKNISAKDLSIELLDDKKPDFDQLIDLIIYYFKNTRRRVIIFEDLDRFDNPKIFEKLRQLNFVLNNRMRLFGKIKFIYAIKDDLFVKNIPKETTIESIRTKIFDLIIPVIPFLSEINYDTKFQNEYSRAKFKFNVTGVEKILSRHSSDMRVIKAIINEMIIYNKTFNLESDKDYRNCAALSIIRMFEPSEFKKISIGKSSLDDILDKCRKRKEDKLKEIEDKYGINNKIKTHSDGIWSALRAHNEAIPQNYQFQNAIIDGELTNIANANTLIKIYRSESDVDINWLSRSKTFTPSQIKKIFNIFVRNTTEELKNKEKEKRELAEQNSFELYSEIKETFAEKSKIPEIITELVDNNFITEDYTRFTAKSASGDININRAKRYIFNYIRGKERNANYSINPKEANIILTEIDNTDLSSTGLYNYDLFNHIIKNTNNYHNQLTQILANARADVAQFMEFFGNYCLKYKDELKNINFAGIDYAATMNPSNTIPPIVLTVEIAKIYPKELLEKISQSSLLDANIQKIFYSITVISLENPINLTLEKPEQILLSRYANDIIKSENGKENLFKLYIANDIAITSLNILGVSKEKVKDYLDRIKLTFNKENLAILDDDILIEYITSRQLSAKDFSEIIKSNKNDAKLYIVKNIKNCINNDELSECIHKAATYINKNKIQLSTDEILQYAGNIAQKDIIRMILTANLATEDIATIMSASNDPQLSKIKSKNLIILLSSNKDNRFFAKKLQTLGLVKLQNSHKDMKKIRLQVL